MAEPWPFPSRTRAATWRKERSAWPCLNSWNAGLSCRKTGGGQPRSSTCTCGLWMNSSCHKGAKRWSRPYSPPFRLWAFPLSWRFICWPVFRSPWISSPISWGSWYRNLGGLKSEFRQIEGGWPVNLMVSRLLFVIKWLCVERDDTFKGILFNKKMEYFLHKIKKDAIME